ncbi:MAG: glycosyltransferase family 4 protein [Croceibacterium sp.]
MALDEFVLSEESPRNGGALIKSIFLGRTLAADKVLRIALIGNYLPRKCGIATFTSDLAGKLHEFHPEVQVDVYALDDPDKPLDYSGIAGTIALDDPDSYAATARRINESGVDAVWLQHEYGIFGGADGEMVCAFIDRLAAPLILTPHTVLREPSDRQRAILDHLVRRASRIQVMSRHSADLLVQYYDAPRSIMQIIPHGAPDRPFGRSEAFKQQLGLSGRQVLMTFGLLGPGKGLEHVIEALPTIAARHPQVLYRIVGATHPNLVAHEGEAYRDRLQARVAELGLSDHVEWDNRFLDTDELLDQLEACDIYITPYPNLQQSTSGTLSYAVALGKAVVSTPYLHATELLDGDAGRLVAPGSAAAIAEAVGSLLDDPAEMLALQLRAYARGRETIWPRFADQAARLARDAAAPTGRPAPLTATPGLTGVLAMTDGTGMMQHSIGVVPDRAHGYCLDDNARALMLMNVAEGISPGERTRLSLTYASFIQDAWNPERNAYRNFMRFDRSWCEDEGSEDSNGRALWALGQTVECAPDPDLAEWAMALFEVTLPHCAQLGSPRTIAFAMLGAAAVLRARKGDGQGNGPSLALLEQGGDMLVRLLGGARRPDWAWFETVLGYDNPRLSQALIEAGMALDRPEFIQAGLETLDWIAGQQISASGQFRAIGSESFGRRHNWLPFDQQPLEAQAAIEASRSAYAATADARWFTHARAAWDWFFGANDRGVILGDLVTGRCRDGITPRGVNANCGAESILAFQLGHYSMLALARAHGHGSTAATPVRAASGGTIGSRGQLAGEPLAHP